MIQRITFEIYEDEAGEFRFRPRSANGEIFGDGYTTRGDAIRGAEDLVAAIRDMPDGTVLFKGVK
jgi:uncharacterized protein YegP (UPF0339 family)